jgi:drug/metabolite transporter (DMT)-like permease
MNNDNKIKPIYYFYIISAIVLWGFSFIWTNQLILSGSHIFTFVFFRMLIAGVALLIFSLIGKKLEKIERKDIKWFLLMVFFEPFIYFIGEVYGIKATNSPTLSSVIIATIPIFALISAQIFYKEKISGWNIFGVIITIPGIGMMVFKDGSLSAEYWWGIALLFMAVLGSVGYTTTAKKLTEKYNSYTITTYQFIIGAIYFLPLFLIFGLDSFSSHFFRSEVLIPLISLAILCSSVSFLFYVKSLQHIGITRTSIFTSLIPAVSAFGAYIYGHETFTAIQIIGISVVVLGVIITQKK